MEVLKCQHVVLCAKPMALARYAMFNNELDVLFAMSCIDGGEGLRIRRCTGR